MTIATVAVYDAIRVNAARLPAGQGAGYSTGSGVVPWGAAEWSAHPGAVRIDQDPAASDMTADVLDVEAGAATIADCPGWCEAAAANYASGRRPGQRHPAVYCSLSNVTAVVDELIAGGIKSGPGLWVANWNLTQAEARGLVAAGGGPFPVIGCQYRNAGLYDVSEFSVAWLGSGGAVPPPGPTGSNWTEIMIANLPTLGPGASGEDVKTIQGLLTARGYPVAADGAYGPLTKNQVINFQHSRGLTADGTVGPKTWPKLLNR